MSRERRIELVTTDDGTHVRTIAANGNPQLVSKPYADPRAARACLQTWFGPISTDASWHGTVRLADDVVLEVREVDERTSAPD